MEIPREFSKFCSMVFQIGHQSKRGDASLKTFGPSKLQWLACGSLNLDLKLDSQQLLRTIFKSQYTFLVKKNSVE